MIYFFLDFIISLETIISVNFINIEFYLFASGSQNHQLLILGIFDSFKPHNSFKIKFKTSSNCLSREFNSKSVSIFFNTNSINILNQKISFWYRYISFFFIVKEINSVKFHPWRKCFWVQKCLIFLKCCFICAYNWFLSHHHNVLIVCFQIQLVQSESILHWTSSNWCSGGLRFFSFFFYCSLFFLNLTN